MNRAATALFLSLCLVVVAGCDDDSDDAEQQTLLAETDETVDDDRADELINQHRRLIGETFQSVAELYDTSCRCVYDDLGFSSRDECADRLVFDDPVIDDGEACVESSARAHQELPTEGVGEYLDCVETRLNDVGDCFQDVRDDYDDLCREEAAEQFGTCGEKLSEAMRTHFDNCSDDATVAARSWIDDVQQRAAEDGCFDEVMVNP